MSFWYLQFFQETIENIRPNYYGTSSQIVFVRFLEELKTQKRHFEITWSLLRENAQDGVFGTFYGRFEQK